MEKARSVEKSGESHGRSSSPRTWSGRPDLTITQQAIDVTAIEQVAGNMAMQRLLRSGVLRAKLDVSQPGDLLEQEADRMSQLVTSSAPTGGSKGQCGCGGQRSEGACPTCRTESTTVQRKATRNTPAVSAVSADTVRLGAGRPLDSSSRHLMESHFGSRLGDVRVHTDEDAAESAESINARAYTIGRDIVFGAGQYAPDTAEGKRLLAHELTHVIQQHGGLLQTIQRQPADTGSPATDAAATAGAKSSTDQKADGAQLGLIVDDTAADVGPTQMKRGEFLSQVRTAASSAAEQTLAPSPWAAVLRPQVNQQLETQFSAYTGMSAPTLEQTIRQQIPGAGGVSTAGAFIPLIAEQVRQNVADGLPKDDTATGILEAGVSAVGGMAQTVLSRLSDVGTILFKANDGGHKDGVNPRAVKSALGDGQPLEGAVRSRMEPAFDQDFSRVRVHTNVKATQLSANFNARAFTVGNDIAFGTGEYHPGTPVGDALIAHELAHVAQQRGGASHDTIAPQGASTRSALEDDADASAVGAVVSLWSGAKNALALMGRNAMPALRSGLRLQRCSKEKTPAQEQQERGESIKTKMAGINRGQSLDAGLWYWPGYRKACQEDPTGTHTWDEAKYRLGYTAAPQFTKTGDFHWTLSSGSASAAIQAWLKGLTVADCASAGTAIYYDTLRASVGDKNFDDYFRATKDNKKRTLIISQYPSETPLKDFLFDAERADGLVEGDWYYWKNHPMYKYKHPAGLWQGENAIYMGKDKSDGIDRWSGFGAENKKPGEMLDTLLAQYNADRSFDDRRALKEHEVGGKLPPEYVFEAEGGTLIKDLGKNSNVIESAGGGLQASGWRLNALRVNALKNR